MTRRNSWSKTVEEMGVRVRLYQRGAAIYREVRLDGEKDRKSLGHGDRRLAEDQARALARSLAELQLKGFTGRLTLGQLFSQYQQHKLPTLRRKRWRTSAVRCMDLFQRAWGSDLDVRDIDQSRVDAYVARRKSGDLTTLQPEGAENRKGRRPVRVRDGTVAGDLSWLSSVFNWARQHRVQGRRLVAENPLQETSWPREKNPKRPVASERRYQKTQEQTDSADPSGRLRCMLALARYTGHRQNAICQLRASDVLVGRDQLRKKLADCGMDERLAEHMPHGAIHWSAETDKIGIMHITPISAAAREELDRYIRKSRRLGDLPLFPQDQDDSRPVRVDFATRKLLQAERLAELPKLEWGAWHPYRRLWASERKTLPDVDVAAAGGWKDTKALKMSYQHSDPDTILRVVQHGT